MTSNSAAKSPRARITSAARRRGPAAWTIVVALGALALGTVMPVVLAALNSVKTSEDYANGGPLALPRGVDLTNVIEFWGSVDFTNKLVNSVLISAGVALVAVILSLLTSYAIGVGRVRGRFWILALFMVTFALPQEALVYPLYTMAKYVGLYDSQWSVVIVLGVLFSAFGTYLLSSVMATLPEATLEAARIDGAGTFRILVSIVTPLMRPTLSVLATFFFIWSWNEFFIPLILLPSSSNQTVSVALGNLFGQYTSDATTSAAASIVGLIPALVFFLIFQRTLMRGVNVGAEK